MSVLEGFFKDVIKPFVEMFDNIKRIKELEKDKEELYERIEDLLAKLDDKKIICYNPEGKDRVIELSDSLVYIQGKQRYLNAYNVKKIFKINEESIDKEWFERALGIYKK